MSVAVCSDPKIDNAHVTDGGSLEGSVRNVACGPNSDDSYDAAIEIQCMADGSWKPEITCVKSKVEFFYYNHMYFSSLSS